MKVEIKDLLAPKDENDAQYFQILPTISIVYQNNKYHVYLAWFNICIHFY